MVDLGLLLGVKLASLVAVNVDSVDIAKMQ